MRKVTTKSFKTSRGKQVTKFKDTAKLSGRQKYKLMKLERKEAIARVKAKTATSRAVSSSIGRLGASGAASIAAATSGSQTYTPKANNGASQAISGGMQTTTTSRDDEEEKGFSKEGY